MLVHTGMPSVGQHHMWKEEGEEFQVWREIYIEDLTRVRAKLDLFSGK